MFVACSDWDNPVTPPATHSTFLRFVSPSGTNILDSLGVFEKTDSSFLRSANPELITANCIRNYDAKTLYINKSLVNVTDKFGPEYQPEGVLLCLEWGDFNLPDEGKKEVIYDFQLQSPRIFGNDEVHRLTWYVHDLGWDYDAYKCEFDGQEVNLDNDPFYNETTKKGYHKIDAILTITCGER